MQRLEVPKFVIMAYDLMEGGDLKSLLLSRGTVPNAIALSEDFARKIFRQLLSAVSFLHGNKIAHKDIKLEIILLQKRNSIETVKISGFQRAEQSNVPGQLIDQYVGTVAYMAPELFKQKSISGECNRRTSSLFIIYLLLGLRIQRFSSPSTS
jgi:serine/threonine protein kinase